MHKAQALANAYIPGIDGLRAIAVLSVFIFHLNEDWLPGGFVGVDIFFVISGYVISKSLAVHDHSSFWPYLLQFYRRRLLRILPALIFVLLTTSLIATMFIPRGWLSHGNEGTALWAFLGLSNFYLVSTADGYFADRAIFNPFLHTWSLAAEEQFYLFFPLLFFFWTLPDKAKNIWSNARLWALPVLVLFSLLFSIYETNTHPERAFYLLQSRFWELGAGSILFIAQAKGLLDFSDTLKKGLFLFGLLLIVLAFVWTDHQLFPFPWAIVPILGTVLIISSLSDQSLTNQPQILLEITGVRFIGRISYSLYLWHWPVFTLFRWTIGLEGALHLFLASILSFLFACVSYYFVETPFRRWRSIRSLDSRIIVTVSCVILALSMFLVSKLYYYGSWTLNLSVTADTCTWEPYFNQNCHDNYSNKALGDHPRNLIVSGDSHAGAYSTMVNLAANDLGLNLITINRSGCSVFSLKQPTESRSICRQFLTTLKERITEVARPGDILFLPSLRVPRYSNQWGLLDQKAIVKWQTSNADSTEQREALVEARDFVTDIQKLGVIVVFDAPKPVFSAPAFRCSDWFNRKNPVCSPGLEVSLEKMRIHRQPTMIQLKALETSNEIEVWDALPYLCDGENCSVFRNDRPLFMDQDHLSGYGNLVLVPMFVEFLSNLINQSSQNDKSI